MTDLDSRPDVAPVALAPVRSRRRLRSLLVIGVMVAAILALLSQGLLHNLNYFETVTQAMDQRRTLGTSTFRLEGVVTKGTITRTAVGADFYLSGSVPKEVFVIERGSPPELFQSDIPVVVNGHFTSLTSSVFEADQIIVKHTASYIAQYPGRVRAPNGTTR